MNPVVKEKIIQSALACMAKTGGIDVSIRDIAAEAEVNVAAINYHFGSKDNLLAEISGQVLLHVKELRETLEGADATGKGQLIRFGEGMMDSLSEHPGIMAVVSAMRLKADVPNQPPDLQREIYRIIELLNKNVQSLLSGRDETYIQNALRIYIGALSGVLLLYQGVGHETGLLLSPGKRALFVRQLVESL